MTSIFRSVTKYPQGDVDPAENRLTEVFGAVLDRVEGLGAALVQDWGGQEAIGERLWVRTQRATAGGRFVDLELAFGAPVVPDLRVWIEIKHGADLHENQLENYLVDLGSEAQDGAMLVLLAPRGAMPAVNRPAMAIEWQAVGRFIASWVKRDGLKSEHQWLLEELLKYLREEGLVDEERLMTAHALELAVRPASERTVARVIEIAHQLVVAGWGNPESVAGGAKPAFGAGWWASFDPARGGTPASGWKNVWFDWTLLHDKARPEPRDSYAFFAGATFKSKKDTALSSPSVGPWLAARGAEGYEYFQEWYWRLWRVLYPEQLLAVESIDEQARLLADWVLKAFSDLSNSPPPP